VTFKVSASFTYGSAHSHLTGFGFRISAVATSHGGRVQVVVDEALVKVRLAQPHPPRRISILESVPAARVSQFCSAPFEQ